MNFWNSTSTCDRGQLCQLILKSIHNDRSYSQEKFGRMHIHQTVILATLPHRKRAQQKIRNKQLSTIFFLNFTKTNFYPIHVAEHIWKYWSKIEIAHKNYIPQVFSVDWLYGIYRQFEQYFTYIMTASAPIYAFLKFF